MQVKEKIIIVLFLVLVSISPLFSKDYQFDAEMQISTEKDIFLVKEPTKLTIKVINHGDYGPTIYPDIESCCIVKDETGRQFYHSILEEYGYIPPMKRGETKTFGSYIQAFYGIPHSEMPELRGVLPPGKYTIQCYWQQPGYVKLESNIITIYIVEPTGSEKKPLLCLWEYYKYENKKDYDNASAELENFFTIYKNSIYAPGALQYKMILHAHIKLNRKKLLECSKFVLENYQDKGSARFFAVHFLLNVYELNGNKEAGIQYLENIASNTNSESLKKVIRQEIEDARKESK